MIREIETVERIFCLGEFLIETENNNLERDQEKIRLKNQLQQALQASK